MPPIKKTYHFRVKGKRAVRHVTAGTYREAVLKICERDGITRDKVFDYKEIPYPTAKQKKYWNRGKNKAKK